MRFLVAQSDLAEDLEKFRFLTGCRIQLVQSDRGGPGKGKQASVPCFVQHAESVDNAGCFLAWGWICSRCNQHGSTGVIPEIADTQERINALLRKAKGL